MCEKHYYKITSRDGAAEKQTRLEYCSQARRRGVTCAEPQKFKHPEGERPIQTSSQHLSTNFPPSPPSSDVSFAHSTSDGERSHKRRSGVYINGQKVAEMARRPSQRERRGSNHVVIVEPPASPRTPPRFESPMGSPLRSPTYIHESRSREYSSYTHPEVRLEVNRPRGNSFVHRDYVASTPRARGDSISQGSSSVSDEEARVRRLKRELKKAEQDALQKKADEAQKEASRLRKIESEIRRANDNIANRPAVPTAPSPLKSSKPSAPVGSYRRPSVSIKQTDMLTDAMRNVQIRESEAEMERRRRDKRAQEFREQQARQDEAAQRERLRARMAPQRSNTASHGGSRRPTVVYNEPY